MERRREELTMSYQGHSQHVAHAVHIFRDRTMLCQYSPQYCNNCGVSIEISGWGSCPISHQYHTLGASCARLVPR